MVLIAVLTVYSTGCSCELRMVPQEITHTAADESELWKGQKDGRMWTLELSGDRFALSIATRGEDTREHVAGTIVRNDKGLTLFVEEPGEDFFEYASGREGVPDDVGYPVFLNWRTKLDKGTEFCFPCCDHVGADHCVVMHRQ